MCGSARRCGMVAQARAPPEPAASLRPLRDRGARRPEPEQCREAMAPRYAVAFGAATTIAALLDAGGIEVRPGLGSAAVTSRRTLAALDAAACTSSSRAALERTSVDTDRVVERADTPEKSCRSGTSKRWTRRGSACSPSCRNPRRSFAPSASCATTRNGCTSSGDDIVEGTDVPTGVISRNAAGKKAQQVEEAVGKTWREAVPPS